jgi:bacterial/archaeal transporter family protein
MTSVSPPPEPERPAERRERLVGLRLHARWLLPTLGFVFALGVFGVTSKLALEHLDWQGLIFWSGAGYLVVIAVMLARGDVKVAVGAGTIWAMVSAVAAIVGLVALYVALGHGPANEIIPISGAYPAVTLIFSAILLRERISAARIVGVLLVIGGVVMITAS